MNWQLTVVIFVLGTLAFIGFILWYQPEARHTPFRAGQVWKNSTGFTMKIASCDSRWLVIKRTTPEGEFRLIDYPVEDFRRLIIKNRYKLV